VGLQLELFPLFWLIIFRIRFSLGVNLEGFLMAFMAEIWGFDWCILVVEILNGLVIYWYET
jgi:hypothetical protein